MVTTPAAAEAAAKTVPIPARASVPENLQRTGKRDAIIVITFGSQTAHLISRRVRELHVYSELVHSTIKEADGTKRPISLDDIKALGDRLNVRGVILSGGPDSTYEKDAPTMDPRILTELPAQGIPVLGICYGAQLIARLVGGKVEQAPEGEYGHATISIGAQGDLLKGLTPVENVWMSHGDSILELPNGYEVLARSERTPVQAFRHESLPIWGVQFHPEVTHTERGKEIMSNFVRLMCNAPATWTIENMEAQLIQNIKEKVGDGTCLVALSGGVDSTTAVTLVAKALGKERVKAVYVDTGLMREGETEQIQKTFKDLGIELHVSHCERDFIEKLRGETDPEKKRMIIGAEFGVTWKLLRPILKADCLVQGTIYPDRVESGATGGNTDTIKTHHNVGGLPEEIKKEFRALVEPLEDLYKDEVRALARQLGLPEAIAERQPFPGPGFGIRVIGMDVNDETLAIVRKADHIVTTILEETGISKRLAQYFAVYLGIKSTGVKGDKRAYGGVIGVRAIVTDDFMTGKHAAIPHEILDRISTEITHQIPSINRVVYDITDKPPATTEWE